MKDELVTTPLKNYVGHWHIFYFFRFFTFSFQWTFSFTFSHFSPGQLKYYCNWFSFLAFLALHHSGEGQESLPCCCFSNFMHCIQFDLTGSSASSGFFPFLDNFLAQIVGPQVQAFFIDIILSNWMPLIHCDFLEALFAASSS